MSFTLPALSYPYNALEPFIDETTMRIHHTKHHQTYIDNANTALNDLPDFSNLSITELIQQINHLPDYKKTILRNNAGGHINHSIFWKCLQKDTILQGSLKDAIEYNFSSISSFKNSFEKTAVNHFGSGWIWLVKLDNNNLSIVSTINQDNPLMGSELTGTNGHPILGLDVWEHAYYLKYQNRRLEYIKSFWNIVNWDQVAIQFDHI